MKKFLQTLFFISLIFSANSIWAQNVSVLEFDGNDSFFTNDVSNKLDVTGSNWTIEFWCFPTASTVPGVGTFPAIISRKYSVEIYFRNNSGSTSQLGVGVIAFDGSGQGFTSEAVLTSGDTELSLNFWHHIAVSYDGTTTRLFFDGTEVGSSTDPDFDLDASIAAFNFGARYDGGYVRYITNCALDEIRYSSTARYTGNFQIGTCSRPFTTDANTILLYHLDENTGTAIANDNDTDFDTSLRSAPNDATWRTYDYFSDDLPLQVFIDGNLTDDLYQVLASKLNTNSGFGSAIDVSQIRYYADQINNVLYLGVVGKLDATSSNGIGIWLNTSSTATGAGAGSALGISGGGHYIGGNGGANPNFKADFEVDYMFAINPGGGSSSVFFDAASQVATPAVAHYQGACDQAGTSATNSGENGTVFTQNSITFAFDNGGGSDQGFEVALPFAQIGNVNSSDNFEVFAFVVSGTAYFSDVTVPGNVTSGNLGFDPDFGTISGGAYHSGLGYFPVELTSFTANVSSNGVQLNWTTATEVDNYGFSVERKSSFAQDQWETIGFVQGHGNSNSPKEYSFLDNTVVGGKYSYRLKQIDTDGSFEYSDIIEVNTELPDKYELIQNYPNPFSKGSGGNPSTTIGFTLPETQTVRLSVFNILGEEVALLLNERKEAGKYNITFDAANLPSGLYLYRLQAGNFSQTKKMMLLK